MRPRKLYTIGDHSNTPPGGWAVIMPEAGFRVTSGTHGTLFAAVVRYRQENGLEPWSLVVFEDMLCRQLPVGSVNCGQEAVDPREFPDLAECIELNARDAPKSEWPIPFWRTLHCHQLTDPDTDEDWLRAYTQLIVCTVTCRPHFQRLQTMSPPPLTDQAAFFGWTWWAHAEVCKSQGKTVISEAEARVEWLHPA